MYLMSAAWGSLAVVLAGLGAAYGWMTWRREGWRGLVLGAALVLLPIGMWLTGTLRLLGFLVDWFAGWATGLVLSPSVIVGTVCVLLAVVLLGVSSRARGRRPAAVRAAGDPGARRSVQGPAPTRSAEPDGPDDLDDIEALLRRHGIT